MVCELQGTYTYAFCVVNSSQSKIPDDALSIGREPIVEQYNIVIGGHEDETGCGSNAGCSGKPENDFMASSRFAPIVLR